jgi:hypothetical protein
LNNRSYDEKNSTVHSGNYKKLSLIFYILYLTVFSAQTFAQIQTDVPALPSLDTLIKKSCFLSGNSFQIFF